MEDHRDEDHFLRKLHLVPSVRLATHAVVALDSEGAKAQLNVWPKRIRDLQLL